MKKTKSMAILLCACFCLYVASCGNTEQAEVTEEEFAREFLTVYWTQDYEGRYSEYQESIESGSKDLLEVTTNYFDTFAEYVSDDELSTMKSNREPYKYENLADLSGATYTIEEIHLEKDDAGMYHYEIEFLWEMEGMDAVPVTTSGDVRVVKADEGWEIGYSYVKDTFAGLEW